MHLLCSASPQLCIDTQGYPTACKLSSQWMLQPRDVDSGHTAAQQQAVSNTRAEGGACPTFQYDFKRLHASKHTIHTRYRQCFWSFKQPQAEQPRGSLCHLSYINTHII